MARPPSALTTFIRSLPQDMPASEVIEKARAEGMEATVDKVTRARRIAGAKPVKKATSKAAAIPTKSTAETSPTAGSAPTSKSDFIRNQPVDMSVATVIAMAKAQGISISESLVRVVRGSEGQKPKATAPRKTPAASKKAPAVAKAPASKPATPSKSDFIRQQPATMSARDIIAAGKKAGLIFTDSLVYLVRGKQGGKAAPKKPEAKRTPAKKAPATKKAAPKKTVTAPKTTAAPGTAKSAGVSKSAFIRLHPNLTTAEVIAAGRDQGLTFTSSLVYAVRGAKAGGKPAPRKAASQKLATRPTITTAIVKPVAVTKPTADPTGTHPLATNGDAHIEDLLRAAASALGFDRALEVIQAERERLRAVLGA